MAKLFERENSPRMVPVLGHKIKVRRVKVLECSEGDELLGSWDADAKMILIQKDADWRTTLLHEILHAILSISGHSASLTADQEESLVLALENALGPLFLPYKKENK